MGKLTAARVKSITKRGLHGDGGTLYLAVAKGGSKSWVQRVTIDGKRHDIGLGGYPYVGLAAARQKAMDNRTAITAGRNPIAERAKVLDSEFRSGRLPDSRNAQATLEE